ncbi:hypothetical protein RFI_07647 [Reticulomyxa filosa]|uniref:Uncharacterized protein n=1 Tax=Reticulomyxa filosa TaxID=46433 RepID=X6NT71_RETFI|nr:hypothetical protein RFI_07647 [Reticulomyxa filosa]|eukprot:ETO29470.1 hypothetical protein RFI_07647 [Reticulomyxa filosa]
MTTAKNEDILILNFFATDQMLAPSTSILTATLFLKAIKCFTILNIKILKCQLKISTIKKISKKKMLLCLKFEFQNKLFVTIFSKIKKILQSNRIYLHVVCTYCKTILLISSSIA